MTQYTPEESWLGMDVIYDWRYAGVTERAWLWWASGYTPAEASRLLTPDNADPVPSNGELRTLAAMRGHAFTAA